MDAGDAVPGGSGFGRTLRRGQTLVPPVVVPPLARHVVVGDDLPALRPPQDVLAGLHPLGRIGATRQRVREMEDPVQKIAVLLLREIEDWRSLQPILREDFAPAL